MNPLYTTKVESYVLLCESRAEARLLQSYLDDKWKDDDDYGIFANISQPIYVEDNKPIAMSQYEFFKNEENQIKELPNIQTIDLDDYFSNLKTKELGRLVLYGEKISSTQTLLMNKFKFFQKGLVAITDEQFKGRGRTSNKWVSPRGCLMFSFKMQLINGNYLCFVQYIISIAIIRAIKQMEGCQNLDIGIKWPNDIYINKRTKIGGIICQSVYSSAFDITLGCGININNDAPSTCIDTEASILAKRPIILSRAQVLAHIMNEFEPILELFSSDGFRPFKDEYLGIWLHSDQKVTVLGDNGKNTNVTIKGLTDEGYLLAISEEGETLQLFPDGNSFNFLQGLISKKI
ncbi:hypothetical protein WA158_002271 [Blastocystis sp. Blastoise]